ncbi:hypothetical protein HGRIS_010415 [Hohenbuehelia grisea]|uniref:Uncharacterized protein n=1 Tax=Hohenbuehelia grisea TaxID=104357 RepID=A0ABR3J4P1_9AGAR
MLRNSIKDEYDEDRIYDSEYYWNRVYNIAIAYRTITDPKVHPVSPPLILVSSSASHRSCFPPTIVYIVPLRDDPNSSHPKSINYLICPPQASRRPHTCHTNTLFHSISHARPTIYRPRTKPLTLVADGNTNPQFPRYLSKIYRPRPRPIRGTLRDFGIAEASCHAE